MVRISLLQRRAHDVGPEPRAILAHAPAFLLETPRARRYLQLPLRLSRTRVLLGIETRKVLADDFGRPVTLHALGPLIPAGDLSLRIEHEDGVILYGIDQQPQVLLGADAGLEILG